MVESGGLENRCPDTIGTVGSNPTLSARTGRNHGRAQVETIRFGMQMLMMKVYRVPCAFCDHPWLSLERCPSG